LEALEPLALGELALTPEQFGNYTVKEIDAMFEGYIRRQKKQVDQFRRTEHMRIPEGIDYDLVPSLRNEARQKLNEIRPASIGQASRIMGVNPADVSVLMIYLKRNSSISQK